MDSKGLFRITICDETVLEHCKGKLHQCELNAAARLSLPDGVACDSARQVSGDWFLNLIHVIGVISAAVLQCNE